METPDPETAARASIRHWRRLLNLVDFAVDRHGFGDSDGGFGVLYPGDLDEYDRSQGESIPEGFVQVYGFWGPPDGYEILVSEVEYLTTLAAVLKESGHPAEAERVRLLSQAQR